MKARRTRFFSGASRGCWPCWALPADRVRQPRPATGQLIVEQAFSYGSLDPGRGVQPLTYW